MNYRVNIITDGYGTGDGGDTVIDQVAQFYLDKNYKVRYLSPRAFSNSFNGEIITLKFRLLRDSFYYKFLSRIPFFYSLNILISCLLKKRIVSGDVNIRDSVNFVILRGDTFFVAHWLQKLKIGYFLYIPDGLYGENDDFLLDTYKKIIYRGICEHASLIFLTNPLAMTEFEKFEIKNIDFLNPYHDFNGYNYQGNKSERIRIVFAGSLYARDAFNVFIKALTVFVGETNIKVDFVIYTSQKLLIPTNNIEKNLNIIINGLIPLDLLKVEIKKSDLCYLPYSFEFKDKKRMICGFPSKASLYFNSLVSVFVHAPVYSSIAQFCLVNGHFNMSNCLDVTEVVSKLRFWWNDGEKRNPLVMSEKFSKELFIQTLSRTVPG